jgi:hydrogenase maturation protease
MGQRVLVAGVGNLFRRDDAFGSEVAQRLLRGDRAGADRPATRALPDGVTVIDYGIRGLHLAYDLLPGWDALIILDAVPDRGAPGALRVFTVTDADLGRGDLDPHRMDPGSVLAGLGALGGRLPPRTLVVGCQVADVGDGIGLSAPVAAAVEPAVDAVLALLASGLTAAGPAPEPARSAPEVVS